jgi:hypothetical protein
MTERKPPGISFESWVDKQIREATERGEFDNLPGAGKPIPGLDRPHDENWWLHNYLRREGLATEPLLPTPLRLRKEIELLPDTVRELRSEHEVREVVGQLNKRIMDWLRAPSGPQLHVGPVRVEDVLEQWRTHRRAVARRPATGLSADQGRTETAPGRARWWRRIARRRRESG